MLLEHFDKISLAGIRFPVLLLISRHATHELVLGSERRCETRLEWESVREYYFRLYEFDGNSAWHLSPCHLSLEILQKKGKEVIARFYF